MVGAPAGSTPQRSLRNRVGPINKWPLPSDPLRIALLLFTILSVSQVHQHFGILTLIHPAKLLFLFAVGWAVLNSRAIELRQVLSTWPARIVIGIAIVACLSVPFGISMGRAGLFVLENYSKTVIYFLLLLAVIRTTRDLHAFVWAYVISAGTLAWMAFFVFTPTSSGDIARLGDLYSYDSNDLGCVLIVALPLSVLTYVSSGAKGKVASAIILLASAGTIARTGSRGAFLGFLGVGLALLLLMGQISLVKRLSVVTLALVALTLAAPAGYWRQMQTLTTPREDYNWRTLDGRRQTAVRGINYMLRYPVFGIGINNFPMAEGTISPKAIEHIRGTGLRWTAAHNSYVQAGAELGVPGLLLWSALVWGGPIAMFRMRRRLPRPWARGTLEERFLYNAPAYVAVALIGFAITSFFVSFAYLEPIYLLAAYMAGLYSSVRGKRGTGLAAAVAPPASRRSKALAGRSLSALNTP